MPEFVSLRINAHHFEMMNLRSSVIDSKSVSKILKPWYQEQKDRYDTASQSGSNLPSVPTATSGEPSSHTTIRVRREPGTVATTPDPTPGIQQVVPSGP